MVGFRDVSLRLSSLPDMRLPIAFALLLSKADGRIFELPSVRDLPLDL